MIELSGVTKSFGANQVLRGIDLRVESNSSMVIIGGSGTGKSVLLKCILGLVHPDMDAAKQLGFSIGDLGDVMEENRKQLNSLLPAFCKVSAIQIHEQEFEKTPKKSIKRYLYQNA